MKDYYRILKLNSDARPETIRRQYRLLILTWHPDRYSAAEDKARAEEMTKDINEAYEVLEDPVKRARYDRERTAQPRAAARPATRAPARPSPRTAPPRPSMDYFHYEFQASRGDAVEISLQTPAQVYLFDPKNYLSRQSGARFQYLGGYVDISPVLLPVPYPGPWHLVVDPGRYAQNTSVAARVVRNWHGRPHR